MKRMVHVQFPWLHTHRDMFLLHGRWIWMLLMFFPMDLVRRPPRHEVDAGLLVQTHVYGSLVRLPEMRCLM